MVTHEFIVYITDTTEAEKEKVVRAVTNKGIDEPSFINELEMIVTNYLEHTGYLIKNYLKVSNTNFY